MAALDEVFERAHPLSFPHLLHPKLLPFLLLLLQPHFVLLFYLLGLGPFFFFRVNLKVRFISVSLWNMSILELV